MVHLLFPHTREVMYGDIVEKYGVFGDDGEAKRVHGFQLGIRYNPQWWHGFGMNTGIFYEYYFDNSNNYVDDDGYEYYTKWEEHSVNIPLHLEFRANFSEEFQLFLYGGASIDIGISSTVRDHYYIDDWESERFDIYGNDMEKNRLNASWEAGAGVRFGAIQLQLHRSQGLIDMASDGPTIPFSRTSH